SNKLLTDIRADMALEYILQQTGWSIGKREFVGQIRTIEFADNITAQAGLQQIIAEYKAEIDAYVESFGGQIINYKFDLVDERGNNTAKRFEYARDIQGLKRVTTDKTMYTALIPLGKDGLTIKSVNNGLNYIYDDEANWLYNDGREYLKGVITKDTITNAQALKDWAILELEKVNHPLSTYEVDVILLAEMLGYEPHQVTLGDTVRVVDLDMDITLSARIIEKTTSFSDPSKNKVVLGDY
ncbi:phage tail protein, partial [Listeria monocytogenes]|nr:phage tail protein [Listeria monocytogenes]